MPIEINSFEYQCWHEVGHAVTCLYMGGDVEFIEFIEDQSHYGLARARCTVTLDIRRYVACGGFATEYILYKAGNLSKTTDTEFIQVMFKNADLDRNSFFNTSKEYEFTIEEDTEFMNFAIDNVTPIILKHLSQMLTIVNNLKRSKRITGDIIKKLLNE